MAKHEVFKYKTADALLNKAAQLSLHLPFQEDIAPLLEPFRIGSRVIPNRMAVHPMEGYDSHRDGAPGEWTFRRYRRYAEGGSGLIWFEATAVVPEGRSNPRQMMITRETVEDIARLVEQTRRAAQAVYGEAHEPYLVVQLTHSGRYSKPSGRSLDEGVGPNPFLDRPGIEYRWYGDDELERWKDALCDAVVLAQEAGFDAVDIKACHGYLLHELLMTHRRDDNRYAGSYENRTRMLREVVRYGRTEAPGIDVAVRMNVTDGIPYPYGFGMAQDGSTVIDLTEPKQLIRELIDEGCCLLNVTAGVPYVVPHIGRPFDRPVQGMALPEEHPLEGVARFIGLAGDIQQAFPAVPVVGTGYSWLRQFWPQVGAAVLEEEKAGFIGLGRGAFAYPDAPKDLMERGQLDARKVCVACSRCTELIRNLQPSGCVIRDRDIYRGVYQDMVNGN